MSKYNQGLFKPLNPKKYAGNVKQIFYRSHWEFVYMRMLDKDPNVETWGSEEFHVPYRSPKDNRIHRYFPDFFYITKTGERYVVEIKPKMQTVPPVKGKKKQKTFLNEVMTYGINTRKWEACEAFCKQRGYTFIIITEKELFGK